MAGLVMFGCNLQALLKVNGYIIYVERSKEP